MEHLLKLKKITLATIKKLFLYKVEPSSYCNFIGTCQKLLEVSAPIRLPNDIPGREGLRTGLLVLRQHGGFLEI